MGRVGGKERKPCGEKEGEEEGGKNEWITKIWKIECR